MCYRDENWAQAQAQAEQSEDADLQARFAKLAQQLGENETKIVNELNTVQGQPVDLGGGYCPDESVVMRPSTTFNAALAALD